MQHRAKDRSHDLFSLFERFAPLIHGPVGDLAVISALAQGDKEKALAAAEEFGWLKKKKDGSGLSGNRERLECESKINAMGLESPWS